MNPEFPDEASHEVLDKIKAEVDSRERELEEEQALMRRLDVAIARTENMTTEDRIQAIIGMLEAGHYNGFFITMPGRGGDLTSVWLRRIPTPGGERLALHEGMGRVTGSGTYRDHHNDADAFTIKIWEAISRMARTPGMLPDRIVIRPLPKRFLL